MASNGFNIRRLAARSQPSHQLRRQLRGGGFLGAMRQRLFSAVRGLVRFLPDRTRRLSVPFSWKRLMLRLGGAGVVIVVILSLFLWLTLPDVSDPRSLLASQSTVITDRNGIELYRLFSEQDRTYIPLEKIPVHLQHGIVSIEDERFYDRGCLDTRAIARAVLNFGRSGGASTITRQLARNALNLQQDNRYIRKLKEFLLGCQLESLHSKEKLLELYLNWIPFGQNAYGIEQASQRYFGVAAETLSLGKSVVLASLPQRPTYFSPYGSHVRTVVSEAVEAQIIAGTIDSASDIPDDGITIGLLGSYAGTGATVVYVGGRADQVLRNMQDQGYITEQERLAALQELETVTFQPSREDIRAPHFVLWVREQVEALFAGAAEQGILEQGGLKIETTLDWRLQEIAEKVVEDHREDLLSLYGIHNTSLVTLDPETREILAYVGNSNYGDEEHGGKIDMARAARQPGSSFKPLVYAAAFLQGYGPATVLYDVPTNFGGDTPQNYDGTFWGLTTVRKALAGSRNIPAAKAFFMAGGEDPILALAEKLGAPSPLSRKLELQAERPEGFDYGWPLALGSAETPLVEMVQAYATLGGNGVYRPMLSIRKVSDKQGNILYEGTNEREQEQVIDPRIAYQVTSVLSDTAARPTEYWQQQLSIPGFETAAKTGTSNKCLEWKDATTCRLRKPDNAWVIGYTPSLVTGVWMGNADSSSLYDKADGLTSASPVWKDYLIRAHRVLEAPKTSFTVPEGLVHPQVSLLSGELPTECTPVALRTSDVFLKERAPTLPDPACAQLTIDKVTGLLASDACPVDAHEDGSFIVAHSILGDRWPLWEEGVQEWVKKQMEMWNASEAHSGALIPLPIAPTEACDPSLTPGRLEKPTVSIVYPQDGGIASHPSFKPQVDIEVGSRVREVTYVLDGTMKTTALSFPYDQPIRVLRGVKLEGQHTLEVTVIDEYYNKATDTVSFRFEEDTGAPVVRFITPGEGAVVPPGYTLQMRAEASDDGGLKFVEFYLDDILLSTKPREPYELTYVLDVEPGAYTLRAVAEDMGKNSSEDSIRITVEEGASPQLGILARPASDTTRMAPRENDTVDGDPVLIAPAEDQTLSIDEILDIRASLPTIGGSSLSRAKLFLTGESGQEYSLLDLTGGQGTYMRQWKSKEEGTYVLRLVTVDRSGVEREWEMRTITVKQ